VRRTEQHLQSVARPSHDVVAAEKNVNCRGVPPPDGITNTSLLPKRLDENAIHRPSGENLGYTSSAVFTVKRTGPDPSSFAVQMSPKYVNAILPA
jgi:hypothetical protein